jgi:hypothetical protein
MNYAAISNEKGNSKREALFMWGITGPLAGRTDTVDADLGMNGSHDLYILALDLELPHSDDADDRPD